MRRSDDAMGDRRYLGVRNGVLREKAGRSDAERGYNILGVYGVDNGRLAVTVVP